MLVRPSSDAAPSEATPSDAAPSEIAEPNEEHVERALVVAALDIACVDGDVTEAERHGIRRVVDHFFQRTFALDDAAWQPAWGEPQKRDESERARAFAVLAALPWDERLAVFKVLLHVALVDSRISDEERAALERAGRELCIPDVEVRDRLAPHIQAVDHGLPARSVEDSPARAGTGAEESTVDGVLAAHQPEGGSRVTETPELPAVEAVDDVSLDEAWSDLTPVQPPQVLPCRLCGAWMDRSARFCGYCGASMTADDGNESVDAREWGWDLWS